MNKEILNNVPVNIGVKNFPLILHIITGLGQGGAESVLHRLITYPKTRFRHVVISLTDQGVYGEKLHDKGIPVYTLGMKPGCFSVYGFWKLCRLIKKEAPSVVQTWMYHADLIGGLAARLCGLHAVIWGIRNSGENLEKSSRSARLVLSLCARLSHFIPRSIVCCSKDAANRHYIKGYDVARMRVIRNGYDLSHFAPDCLTRKHWRDVLGVKEDECLIGCVARWNPLKDHDTLLEAWALLDNTDLIDLDITLQTSNKKVLRYVLVGSGMTADNQDLAHLIDRLSLRHQIVLLGAQKDISSIMNALDIHVLASCAEGFPNVLAEAMACGTPCVTTDVGEAAYIVQTAGWVVPAGQPKALAQAIAVACDTLNKQGRLALGKIGRARVEKEFGLERMVQEYEEVWSQF